MFLFKISENIYILPIWASTVINQIVNEVINALKQHHHINPIFLYLTKKRHIQTQARQDKAWQGMARHGKARPGEARRGKTRRRPDKKVSPGFEKYCTASMLIMHLDTSFYPIGIKMYITISRKNTKVWVYFHFVILSYRHLIMHYNIHKVRDIWVRHFILSDLKYA